MPESADAPSAAGHIEGGGTVPALQAVRHTDAM